MDKNIPNNNMHRTNHEMQMDSRRDKSDLSFRLSFRGLSFVVYMVYIVWLVVRAVLIPPGSVIISVPFCVSLLESDNGCAYLCTVSSRDTTLCRREIQVPY